MEQGRIKDAADTYKAYVARGLKGREDIVQVGVVGVESVAEDMATIGIGKSAGKVGTDFDSGDEVDGRGGLSMKRGAGAVD